MNRDETTHPEVPANKETHLRRIHLIVKALERHEHTLEGAQRTLVQCDHIRVLAQELASEVKLLSLCVTGKQ